MVLHGIVLLASARGLYLARHLPTLYIYIEETMMIYLHGSFAPRRIEDMMPFLFGQSPAPVLVRSREHPSHLVRIMIIMIIILL